MRIFVTIAAVFLFLFPGKIYSQLSGIIIRPAGTSGPLVLDPNADGYTSVTTSGFGSSDISNSEIIYKTVPPLLSEPTGDLLRGPNGKFSDIVKTIDGSGFYLFNDGTNILFRIRMGSIISGSKGYSVLIDTDEKFGRSGPDADPNYVPATNGNNGNPGFELEVVYETNFRIAIYNVDGTSTPAFITSHPLNTHSQISLAFTNDGGNPDFFYDFFVPFTDLGINASTPLRVVATTVMAPTAAIGGPKSDIYGLSGKNYMSDWENIINRQPAFRLSDIIGGGSGPGVKCTASPVVDQSISPSASTITGTWTKSIYSSITTAAVTLYKNGISIGSTSATSGNVWSVSVSGLSNNDLITAKALAIGESQCLSSNQVIVNGCTNATHTAMPVITCSSLRGFEGTMAAGASVRLFTRTASGYFLFADDASTTHRITYPTTTTWRYDDVNVQSGSACTGGPSDIPAGSYTAVADLAGSCTSLPVAVCINGSTAPSAPAVTSFLVDGASSIIGSATAGSWVNLWVDGYFMQSVTAVGGIFTFNLTQKLQLGQQIEINSVTSGSCLSTSFAGTVTCYVAAPVINANNAAQVAIGSQLSGTSASVAGTTITIYNGSTNAVIGTATVQSTNAWTMASPLITAATSYYARVTGSPCGISAASATAIAALQTSAARCGSITGPVSESAISVSGTVTTAVANTTVSLYVDGVPEGSVIISGTAWTIPVNTTVNNTIYAGAELTLGIAESAAIETICPATLAVSCNNPSVPSISPASSSIQAGEKVTYTVTSSQSGILYSIRNNADTINIGKSFFGNGATITLESDAFDVPGTYAVKIKSTSFSGANCEAVTPATVSVAGNMPVSLLNFSGKFKNGIAHLNWTITNEQNLMVYEVEKSYTGNHFIRIGSIKPLANNQLNKSYLFHDSSIFSNVVYYKIKMIDNNHTNIKYSEIIAMYTGDKISINNVTPNPFKDAVSLNVTMAESGILDIAITDITGRKIKSEKHPVQKGINQVKINGLKKFANGVYIFRVSTGGTLIEKQILIKN